MLFPPSLPIPRCQRRQLAAATIFEHVQAVPSWFVKVEDIRDKLVANNLQTYWVPQYVQEKRFQNWLENARDWAISRSRYWGTPIPIWQNSDGSERVVVSSVEQLEKLTGVRLSTCFRFIVILFENEAFFDAPSIVCSI